MEWSVDKKLEKTELKKPKHFATMLSALFRAWVIFLDSEEQRFYTHFYLLFWKITKQILLKYRIKTQKLCLFFNRQTILVTSFRKRKKYWLFQEDSTTVRIKKPLC